MSQDPPQPPPSPTGPPPPPPPASARTASPRRPEPTAAKKSSFSTGCLLLGLLAAGLVVIALVTGFFVVRNASKTWNFSADLNRTSAAITKERVAGTKSLTDSSYIAQIHLQGVLLDSEQYRELIEYASNDASCKALLLVVDSPGGAVTAADEIWARLKNFQKTGKPLVVSMGTIAASGGYYISAPADWIVASPTSLTGSIGVIIQTPAYKEALDKLGIEIRTFTSGPNKAMLSPTQALTDEQKALVQALVDESYQRFLEVVSDGRDLAIEDLREQGADGRILSAMQAKRLGLIDEIGYWEQAVYKAAELAGISADSAVMELSLRPSLAELFSSPFSEVKLEIPLLGPLLQWSPDSGANSGSSGDARNLAPTLWTTALRPATPYYLAPQGVQAHGSQPTNSAF